MEEIKTLFELEEIKVKKDFKSSLKYLVEEHSLEAVIMGSRRADPYCGKNKIQFIFSIESHLKINNKSREIAIDISLRHSQRLSTVFEGQSNNRLDI